MEGSSVNFLNILTLIINIANLFFILFVMFFERKDASRRLIWIFILYLLPFVGLIFYILFSGHFFTGSKRMKEANRTVTTLLKPVLVNQQEFLIESSTKFPNHVMNNYLPLVEMNISKCDSLLVSTDSLRLYTTGQDFFKDLCVDLENAKHTIYMEYFIFKSDKIGKQIMEILCRKAKEGVVVKLLYDDLGSLFTRTRFFKQLDKAGGQTRPFFQIRIGFPFTLNYRNHRKTTVIDSTIAYTGGVNIGDEYANQSKRIKLNWRDTVIRMTGASVLTMQGNFSIDWCAMDAWYDHAKTSKEIISHYPPEVIKEITKTVKTNTQDELFASVFKYGHIPTQIITAGPDEAHKAKIEDALLKMIMSAKKYVYLQSPYFTPDEQFYTALKIAAFSGVDVRVMIPGQWDKFYMKAASSEFARQMIGEGVKVYLYNGFIHSKTIVVDGNVCSIGTTNIDNRSFSLHFEQNVVFYDEGFASECERIFLEDIKNSSPVHKIYYDKKPMIVRAFWSFCKLFSALM